MNNADTQTRTPPQENDAVVTLPTYGTPSFYGGALLDEAERTKFLKEIVSTARKSPEYARYRQFLIENLDMGNCSILSGLSDEESRTAGLELHHAPLDLYSIAELVLGQMEYDGDRITTMAAANRVMAYHWRGMVGLVPVVESVHEMLHTGQLRLDPRMIHGNWQGLLSECAHGITEHLAEKLRTMAETWSEGVAEYNAQALSVNLQRWVALPVTTEMLLEGPPDGADEEAG
jgi:hypothetical protein